MKHIRIFCLVLYFGAAVFAEDAPGKTAPAAATAKTKILFIGKNTDHPYGAHMYMYTNGVLAKCVELAPGVETVVSNGWPEDAAALAGVKCIVIYTDPAAEFFLDGPNRGEFEALMKKGVGLVTLHWASSIKKENFERLGAAWMGYTGATWISNVGLSSGASPLVRLVPEHPVCKGWKEFEINDEYYLSPVIKGATPLLQVHEKGGADVVVGWVFERPDGGRSFGTTLGHSYTYFQNELFRRMIVNGILWSARVEIPADGAPVNVSKEALVLPPKP